MLTYSTYSVKVAAKGDAFLSWAKDLLTRPKYFGAVSKERNIIVLQCLNLNSINLFIEFSVKQIQFTC